MKGVVVYDTYYGNTKLVAEAIAEQLRAEGHEVDLRDVGEKHPAPPQGDMLFLGSPVRMGATTRRVRKFVDKLDVGFWRVRPIVVFTTILALPENATDKHRESREKWDLAAGRKLSELARSVGLNAIENRLWVEVKGNKGPLVESGIEKTKQFTHEMLLSLKS